VSALYPPSQACRVHGAGGAPRQAQVLFARSATGIPAHSCQAKLSPFLSQECIPVDTVPVRNRNVVLTEIHSCNRSGIHRQEYK